MAAEGGLLWVTVAFLVYLLINFYCDWKDNREKEKTRIQIKKIKQENHEAYLRSERCNA